jgi:hypothetical protein
MYDYHYPKYNKVMKQKILLFSIIAFLQLQVNINAQEYIPMAINGAHWIVKIDFNNTPEPVDDLWEYYAYGDTILDNVLYTNIYKRKLVVTQGGPPFEPNGSYELFGFIRDDTINKKVYAIHINEQNNCPLNEEYLLFDFSVNVGDTAIFCLYPNYNDYIISSIEYGNFLDFDTRIFSNNQESDYFEGMGSYFGLFEEMFAPFKSDNGRYVYHTFLYYYCRETPCDLLVTAPQNTYTPIIRFFPNPTNGILRISNTMSIICDEIIILNMQGKPIERIDINNTTKENTYSISNLFPGLYIALLLNKGSIVEEHKIIVVD